MLSHNKQGPRDSEGGKMNQENTGGLTVRQRWRPRLVVNRLTGPGGLFMLELMVRFWGDRVLSLAVFNYRRPWIMVIRAGPGWPA